MKKCPKCGDEVSCKRWMYRDKMCRKCSHKVWYKKKREEEVKKRGKH